MAPCDAISGPRCNLFERDGVYYARVPYSIAEEPLVVALHGIRSEEQARAALAALTRRPIAETAGERAARRRSAGIEPDPIAQP